jgi:hypothetical protein
VYSSILLALRSIVLKDLATDFFANASPNQEHVEHTRRLLSLTLLRDAEWSWRDVRDQPFQGRGIELADKACQVLLLRCMVMFGSEARKF